MQDLFTHSHLIFAFFSLSCTNFYGFFLVSSVYKRNISESIFHTFVSAKFPQTCPVPDRFRSCISHSAFLSAAHFLWRRLICAGCDSALRATDTVRGSMSQKSDSVSDESLAQRTVATSVIRDTGTKVQLLFKAHGLKKRKSLLNSIVTVFKKVSRL
ncbi:hypothetical protein ANCCAN_24447 [Ancylostoma caninum]|uniref:Uncharacterized protein n=1 Tax=Ancylostoma caninum TaxID=29170 RepID=A0A368FCE2_ANCCA|nr:hypothetical protein ANCCAN_24447 [Ancylostoma caninum]